MRTGNIRAVQMLLGHKSIRTTEIYSHLSERHLHHVVGQLPGPKMGTLLGTPVVLPGRSMAQNPKRFFPETLSQNSTLAINPTYLP
jgi:hypothetical protein